MIKSENECQEDITKGCVNGPQFVWNNWKSVKIFPKKIIWPLRKSWSIHYSHRQKKAKGGIGKRVRESSDSCNPDTKAFLDELRYVYHKIDKESNCLWSHDGELIKPKRRSLKRASKPQKDTKNSKNKDDTNNDSDSDDWQAKSNAQIGYGEITKGAMQNFFSILQIVDKYFKPEHDLYLKYNKKKYRLTEHDTFIDIGSGFGKPVYHAAMQVGCISKGVEIVPARVTYWIDFIYEYEKERKYQIKRGIKNMQQKDKAKLEKMLTPTKSILKASSDVQGFCNPLAFDYWGEIDQTKETEESKKSIPIL